LKTGTKAKNITDAIKTYAMPILQYDFGVLRWTQNELRAMDTKTRKTLTKHGFHHPKSNTHQLYLSRKYGRGLIGAIDCHQQECSALANYLNTAREEDPLVKIVERTECRKINGIMSLNLPTEIKEKVRHCLKMIEFGMQSCLITFDSKYFEYRGDGDSTDKGLAIGGYESAFLADLVASFLLEKTNHHFENTKFHGIYRDDGLVIFNDNKRFYELANWLENFQTDINALTGGTFLPFPRHEDPMDDSGSTLLQSLLETRPTHTIRR